MLGRCVTGNQGSNDDVSNFPEVNVNFENLNLFIVVAFKPLPCDELGLYSRYRFVFLQLST